MASGSDFDTIRLEAIEHLADTEIDGLLTAVATQDDGIGIHLKYAADSDDPKRQSEMNKLLLAGVLRGFMQSTGLSAEELVRTALEELDRIE